VIPTDVREIIGPVPQGLYKMMPSVPFIVLDEQRIRVQDKVEERNLAACLFGLEQSSSSQELFSLGESLNTWMSQTKEYEELRREFSQVFEYSIKPGHTNQPFPNPFKGETMLAEKVNRWIAEYKAEGKIEGRVEGKVEGRAEGKVEGRAEGIVLSLKRLITKNTISIEEAKTEIEELEKNGVLNQEEVKRISRELGIR
jgi:hypothetical protein